MSETENAPPGSQQAIPLVVNVQYIKDMSFEVPNAPAVFSQMRAQPAVNINLDVQARRVTEGQHVYEVVLMIRAEAHQPPTTNGQEPAAVQPALFVAELAYGGVFTLNSNPRERDRAGAAGGMPAHPVPVRAQHPGRRHARWRVSPGAAAADRLCGAVAVPPPGRRAAPGDAGSGVKALSGNW